MEHPTNKKPPTDFVIRLVGSGVRPWAVPMRSLTRVLDAVQRLVEQRTESEESPSPVLEKGLAQRSAPDGGLRLIDIKSSSAAYQISAPAPRPTLERIAETGRALLHPETATWTDPTLSSVGELSEVAKALGCEIEFRLPDKGRQHGEVIAVIRPDTYAGIAASAFITGDTSVYARIERVGGATEMHCGIRLPGQAQRMVICRVHGEELVRELGRYIYQEVFLSGEGTWLRHNLQLKRLDITSFEAPKVGSIRDALRNIHAAGGHAWDRVKDPDSLIREFRRA